jgi:hypothetical protein
MGVSIRGHLTPTRRMPPAMPPGGPGLPGAIDLRRPWSEVTNTIGLGNKALSCRSFGG